MPGIGGYPIELQEESEWCWAAVALSVVKYFQNASQPQTQCAIASKVLHSQQCCLPDKNNICNQPVKLGDALGAKGIGALRQAGEIPRPLRFEEVQRELDAHRPICIRIGWDGGGAHAVVITGYQVLEGGIRHVDVADPMYPDCTIDYEELTNAYHGDGQWTHSYLLKGE